MHNRVLLGGRFGALEAGIVGDGVRLREEGKELVPRWLPLNRELLEVDNLVSVHELLNEVTGLGIVHGPDLLNTLIISLFEPFETFLELDELISEDLIFLRE